MLGLSPALRQRQSMLSAQGSAENSVRKGFVVAAVQHSDGLQQKPDGSQKGAPAKRAQPNKLTTPPSLCTSSSRSFLLLFGP